MKNIYFVGSSCVGKTSVLDLLIEDPRFKGYNIQKSLSRELIREGVLSGSFDSIKDQHILFEKYCDAMLKNKTNTVFDRSLIDVYTFTETLEGNDINLCCELAEQLDVLETIRALYDDGFVFYFPIYWNVECDGERLDDERKRIRWDYYIEKFLKREQIPFYSMRNEPPKERVDFIYKTINSSF